MRKLFFLTGLFISLLASAQVTDGFSDGNFTANPAWTGSVADWTVNSAGQLQSNTTTANANFYLATANTLATTAQWEFFVRLNFNTSSANYVDVFLTASASDLSAASTTGYFVRIGNTADEIALYRKDASGATKIIDGVDGITNTSDNTLKIKVIRDAANTFTLYRDASGTGTTYSTEGSVTDATYSSSAFFGFFVRQSTASFFQRHYFDDILVQPYAPDVTPPSVVSATPLSSTTLDVLFSEPVDIATSEVVTNYVANNGIGSPASAVRDAANTALVHLTFSTAFPNGLTNILTVNGVKDLAGNALSNGTRTFSFYTAQRYDVVIHEIMADPTPTIGLPNAEYIELRNVSGREINLQGWRITTSTGSSGAFTTYALPADSFLIVSSSANASLLAPYGRVLGVASFPSLDNDGSTLSLVSREGQSIHSVAYTKDWYGNAVKADGGWSLEMIDAANPCSGSSNWTASTDGRGGTPGMRNSVARSNPDATPPALVRTYTVDDVTIILLFDEPMDSASAAVSANYSISNGLSAVSANPVGPLFASVLVRLSAPMQPGTVYTVTVRNLKDCKGNIVGTRNSANAGLPQTALAGNVMVNEILFNPKTDGQDYVELYNRSTRIIDLSKLFIANRSSTGVLSSLRKISETPLLLFPESYIVVTEDPNALRMQYLVKDESAVVVITSLPSLPDDKGVVVVVNEAGAVVDEVAYTDDWHFGLLANNEGVSLERIDSTLR